MGDSLQHIRADQVNPLWLGWKVTARNRADGQTVTGVLSDFDRLTNPAEVRLYMGGRIVELRDGDTVTAGGLDVLGGAAWMGARVFTARFPGRCHADCGESIEPGDDVTYVDDQIVHLECAGAAELDHRRAERPAAICPTCHLTKPCEHEEAS